MQFNWEYDCLYQKVNYKYSEDLNFKIFSIPMITDSRSFNFFYIMGKIYACKAEFWRLWMYCDNLKINTIIAELIFFPVKTLLCTI